MTKPLLPILACTALLSSAAGHAPDPPPDLAVESDLRPAVSVLEPAPGLGQHSLTDQVLARTAGAGPTSDFLCGAATGAGFALALSGVGAGPGLALAGAGMVCAMFF